MAKAKVTYLGQGDDKEETDWGPYHFKVGEPTEVDDPRILEKASYNRFFKVEGYEAPPRADTSGPKSITASAKGEPQTKAQSEKQ
jgi:hypothetical protein